MSPTTGRATGVGRAGTITICALAGIVLFVGTLMAYGRREVFNLDSFQDRTVDVIHEPAVHEWVSRELTDRAIDSRSPDLVTYRPVIESTISRLLDTGAADAAIRVAAASTYQRLFARDPGPILLSFSDVLVLARGVLAAVQPGAEAALPDASTIGEVVVADRDESTPVRIANSVRILGLVLPLVALAVLAVAIALARDRRRAVVVGGLAIAGAGVLTAFAMAVVHAIVLSRLDDGDARDVGEAIWRGFLGDLRWWAFALVGAGVIIAAAAASALPQTDVIHGVRRVWTTLWATPPGRLGTAATASRAVTAIAIGIFAIADPLGLLQLLFLIGGVIAITWGVSELVKLTAGDEPAEAAQDTGPRARRIAGWATGGVASLALVGLGVVALASPGEAAPPAPPPPCNGHEELCDRPINEVAFLTSHNAMSAASQPGWFNAHHYNPIVNQLDAGVRGLLIDTWRGQETSRSGFGGTTLVQTDLSETSRAALEAEIGAESVAAAERLAGTLVFGEPSGAQTLYMCHSLCEIGAVNAAAEFTRIREWLDDHPDQVVIIIIQDEASVTEDVAAMQSAGLDARAWPERLAAGDPLPTLREMIDSGKTALIAHESPGSDGPAWYQPAYDITQETPFTFPTRESLLSPESCVPNRGPANARLFLLNHWLAAQPVKATEAETANARDVLETRARLCETERGLFPNLIGINFVEIGDGLAVVDALNGVEQPAP